MTFIMAFPYASILSVVIMIFMMISNFYVGEFELILNG